MSRSPVIVAKRSMILINTARGPVVDIGALYDAMKDGAVQAAGSTCCRRNRRIRNGG